MDVWLYEGISIFKLSKGQYAFDKHEVYPTLAAAKKDVDRLIKESGARDRAAA